MKKYLYLLVFASLFSCDTTKQEDASSNIYIDVDHADATRLLDISSLFLPDAEFIGLETSEDILISFIKKMRIEENAIYISDIHDQGILVFDNQGKFIRSIGRKGLGPEEYSEMGDFIVSGDSIFIQDRFKDKILIYNTDGRYLSRIMLKDFDFVEFYKTDDTLCFFTNNKSSEFGNYNIITYNLKNQEYNCYAPFEPDNFNFWRLGSLFSTYNDEKFLILAGDHTIYHVKDYDMLPKWTVHFSKDEIPDELKEKDLQTILTESSNKGYIKGIGGIRHTPDYLFFSYSHGDESRNVLYNRHTHKVDICGNMVINDLGKLFVSRFVITSKGDFIIIQDAGFLKSVWEQACKNNEFKNPVNREKMETLINSISDDSNPVMIKLKLNLGMHSR